MIIDEGYVVTLENDKEYLLLHKHGNSFLAVEMKDEEMMLGKYYMLKQDFDEDGDMCLRIMHEMSAATVLDNIFGNTNCS